MGEMRSVYRILVGIPEWKNHSEDIGVDGKVMLEWILGKQVEECGLDVSGLGKGSAASCCEHGNEPSGVLKGG
jgi:hypothetical protein